MSLPIGYNSHAIYFFDVLSILKQYSWVFKTANTNFIKENVLDNFSEEWSSYFLHISSTNLSLFPESLNKDIPSAEIKMFQNKVLSLKPNLQTSTKNLRNSNNMNLRKINPKKIHEISTLANLILKICSNEIDILIDFGCGLGYLSQYLYKINQNIRIIGLESDSGRVSTATKRLEKYYSTAKRTIFFVEHYINESSFSFIQENVTKLYPHIKNPKLAIIGLHSCADLTNISMEIFLESIQIKKLIIIPCCYHKLKILETNEHTNRIHFKNFPLSMCLKKQVTTQECGEILNRPFLRLASQQTASRWRDMNELDHMYHGQEMFVRGLVETIRNENEVICKRKNIKIKEILKLNLDSNLLKLIYGIELTKEKEEHIKKLITKYPYGWKFAEALTCLQISIQQICENLILLDRICYMNEQSEQNNIPIKCKFEKILEDKLSPRCNALIAEKIYH